MKSFDISIAILPSMGCANTDKIAQKMKELNIKDDQIISVIKVMVNPDPEYLLNHEVQRVFYRA